MAAGPRIVLIHALQDSQRPAWAAFASGWPAAEIRNLLDDSLASDLAAAGALEPAMIERFLTLGRYAAAAGAAGILFTCSAFGPAIAAVRAALAIPVLTPTEAAFEAALARGPRIGLVVTFRPSLAALSAELRALAARTGRPLALSGVVAEGALEALQAGRGEEHDARIRAATATLPPLDALILGQFSAARAAAVIPARPGCTLLTTPDAAVAKLKRLVA